MARSKKSSYLTREQAADELEVPVTAIDRFRKKGIVTPDGRTVHLMSASLSSRGEHGPVRIPREGFDWDDSRMYLAFEPFCEELFKRNDPSNE
jgi:hypothetical protein